MSVIIGRLAMALSLTTALISAALAQPQDAPLRVATFVIPPSTRLGVKSSYRMTSDVNALFDSLGSGNADVAVSGLFYSSERDRDFDFSYPIMDTGLQVMVRDAGDTAAPQPLLDLLELLFSRGSLVWLGVAVVFIVVGAHFIWILERRLKDGTMPDRNYFPGIFHAMYWAATTLMMQADQVPRQWFARTLAILWMFVGIIFIAFYTAQLTTNLTVRQIQGAINGPDDLPGKRVGTLRGASAVAYLREHGALVEEFPQPDQVHQALLDRRVDAVVRGAAGLQYYAAHEGRGLVRMVGPEFNKNDVGFVFPLNSPLRKKANGALLILREDGTYQRIYDKWFGTK